MGRSRMAAENLWAGIVFSGCLRSAGVDARLKHPFDSAERCRARPGSPNGIAREADRNVQPGHAARLGGPSARYRRAWPSPLSGRLVPASTNGLRVALLPLTPSKEGDGPARPRPRRSRLPRRQWPTARPARRPRRGKSCGVGRSPSWDFSEAGSAGWMRVTNRNLACLANLSTSIRFTQ